MTLNFFEMELMRSPETVENDEGDSAYQRERLMQVYAQEKLMIDYISKENYYDAVSVIRKSNAQGLEARTDNNLRDVKNYSIVFNTICSLVRNARPAVYSPLVQEMIDLTEAAFSEELTLKDIAEKLNHSSNYLSMKFKKETGKTFSEFLLEIRLRYAKELLSGTNLPIAAVAEESGIPDNNYFSRIFRQREKLTPREYRKEKQKENLG
ncbi:helix-turn-helix domain-containing protein [Lachnospiraceae bacterium C1.1]|nr:helix-turn-helix transcriptional regulator [Lachnospiraceae bacterium C1.1]